MGGDTAVAIEFLGEFYPDGPWVLVAIEPDRKGIETRTFLADQLQTECREWIDKWNGRRNIYFSVNPPRRTVTKKLERQDIAALAWLHVDLDPRAGENLDEERTRILARLTTGLPQGVPEPTCIIFSGGGYQAFWRLEDPMPLDGTQEQYEQAKRYNLQLEMLFGADSCHNVDRIMRVPGTVNIPNAQKRKKGRSEVTATLEVLNPNIYPLDRFTPAPEVQSPDLGFGGNDRVTVDISSGNVERLADINELDEWGVADRVKVIAVQGNHPDEVKEGDNSRSAWLFDFVCNCLRAGVPDEVVFSIITDPNFMISASVLDKGANAEKYAFKQIRDGKEHVIEPALRDMNLRHAIIRNLGGRCLVVEEVPDPTFKGRARLTKQSFGDIKNGYMHRRVQVGKGKDGAPVFKPLGQWWLAHELRRQYDYLVFSPERDVPNSYNLWQGFACEALPGTAHEGFLKHVHDNVCAGDEDHYNYLVMWLARMIQHPASQGHVAVVLRGGQGTGKSFFATMVGELFGRHFLHISDSSHLVGNFNSHLRDCLFLFADEAFYAGDKKHESKLKTLITEETLTIEAKGVDVETAPNYIHLMMASNAEWVVPAGGDERRYFVLNVGDEHKQDATYFKAIAEQMDNGGREHLLHYLLNLDITGFDVRSAPKTSALADQKEFSLAQDEEWWYSKLCSGTLLTGEDGWPEVCATDALQADYVRYMESFRISRRGNATLLGKFLKRILPGAGPRVTRRKMRIRQWSEEAGAYFDVDRDNVRVYVMPDLERCRAHWEATFGTQDWEPAEPSQEQLPGGDTDIPF